MSRLPQVLICDDDQTFQLALKNFLKTRFNCRTALNTDEAAAILKNHSIDIILLDVQMRSHDEGLQAIPKLLAIDPEVSIIMSSGLTDFATVREAMRLGAKDYIRKSDDPSGMLITLEQVLTRRGLERKKDQQAFEAVSAQKKHVLVGNSFAIRNLRNLIDRIRASNANVVITGETGTGKEVVARQLRKTLPDGSLEPFIAIDSATIQSSTAESVLFGYEKGAFTGAEKSTKGVFEEANGGVVYFDELANMPLEIQAKLLRVLQEKEVMRLGSSKPIQLDFRVIAATNRNLEQMIQKGEFKDDLFQRMCVLPIQLPPLRDRKEDIPELVQHFVERHSPGRNLTFTADALETLQSYRWPGNIRELGNVVAYLSAMCETNEIDLADLPPQFRDADRQAAALKSETPATTVNDLTPSASNHPSPDPLLQAAEALSPTGMSFYSQVARFEKEVLSLAYQRSGGNMSKLALSLGMDRSYLYKKLREHELHQKNS